MSSPRLGPIPSPPTLARLALVAAGLTLLSMNGERPSLSMQVLPPDRSRSALTCPIRHRTRPESCRAVQHVHRPPRRQRTTNPDDRTLDSESVAGQPEEDALRSDVFVLRVVVGATAFCARLVSGPVESVQRCQRLAAAPGCGVGSTASGPPWLLVPAPCPMRMGGPLTGYRCFSAANRAKPWSAVASTGTSVLARHRTSDPAARSWPSHARNRSKIVVLQPNLSDGAGNGAATAHRELRLVAETTAVGT